MDEKPSPDWLRSLPTRSEDVGYSPDELRTCEACGKPNAPNRPACLYCGAEFAGVSPRIEIRYVEDWENGHNLILVATGAADPAHASRIIGSTLGIDAAALSSLLSSGKSLPLARLESEEIATTVANALDELAIATRLVSDETLAVGTPHVRLRGLTFREDELTMALFNSDETAIIHRGELALFVTGVIHESRTEATEKRKRGATKTLSESHTSHDQPFIDIYSRHDPVGWRIPSSGFDFSCLGEDKSLLAGENLERLAAKLARFAPAAKFVDDYLDVRPLLEHVWPSEHRREAFGFQRSGFARKDLSSLKTSSNLTQVNKYSRLQWQIL